MAYQGGRKFLVASKNGNGFIVAEDECLANTRKGKQVLNLKNDAARALAAVSGELVAVIGENRKMVTFDLKDVPEMARGRGVRLQRYKDGGLSDVTTFKADEGLTWIDTAGRSFTQSIKELKPWRGNRGDAGRIKPDRFLTNLKFAAPVQAGKNGTEKAEGG
jgi:topoisomerase-4 subunit A